MIKENAVLEQVLWPINKLNILGNLVFSDSIDFDTVYSVAINRREDKLEIFYTSNPIADIENKTYFVKLHLNKVGEDMIPDFEKSSPTVKDLKDVEDVLIQVNSTIAKMNVKPTLFSTGVVPTKEIKNKM